MTASKAAWALGCAGLVLAGCGKAPANPAGPAPQAQADTGYRAPPEPVGVIRGSDGAVSLTGHAIASSTVRMVSPAGARVETVADGAGTWTAALGPVSEPTLYRLAEEAQGQRIEAQGYVAVMPGTAAVLRAGVGAQSLEAARPGLRILALDLDGGGGAVISGRGAASSPVRIAVDGMLAMDGASGPDGRFMLTLTKPLAPGAHTVQVSTPKGSAQIAVTAGPPTPPADGPYKAVQQGSDWRVDWLTPGGAPQTTWLIGG